MRLYENSCIAAVIDIQERLFPAIHGHARLMGNCSRLIRGLRVLKIPLLVTEQYTKGLGVTIPKLRDDLGEDYQPIEKRAFSCCGQEDFLINLKESARDKAILFGIETHVCVQQTALDLIEENFQPVIVEDCCSSRNENNHNIAIERLRGEGALITTCESLLMEILRDSSRKEFREISAIIK